MSKYFENFMVYRNYLYNHFVKISYIYCDYFWCYIKNKIDFVKNWLRLKIPVFYLIFLLCFPTRFQTIGNFLFLTPSPKVLTRFINLPEKMLMKKIGALLQLLNIITVTKKKKKNIIVDSTFRSESYTIYYNYS